ncbi:LysM peptidoglycan-binding domain-containing protein [Jatrophihabitans fulvus]
MTIPLQPLTAVDTPARLAAAAALTAGLVATSAVALTVVLAGDTRAAADPGVPHALRAAASDARGSGSAPAGRTPTAAPRPLPSFASSPVALRSPVTQVPVVYTVKPGDSLTAIARWFRMQGYEQLYLRNRDAIGANPDLIRPGQVVTITPRGATASMTVTSAP